LCYAGLLQQSRRPAPYIPANKEKQREIPFVHSLAVQSNAYLQRVPFKRSLAAETDGKARSII